MKKKVTSISLKELKAQLKTAREEMEEALQDYDFACGRVEELEREIKEMTKQNMKLSKGLIDELFNISNNQPVFAGKLQSHQGGTAIN